MLELATDVSKNYSLVRDARLKPAMAEDLQRAMATVNYLKNAITAHTTRSQLALPVVSAWSAGFLMFMAPYMVDVLGLTPGTFLATLRATASMGTQLKMFFAALAQMQLSIASLLEVFTFLVRSRPSNLRLRICLGVALMCLPMRVPPRWRRTCPLSRMPSC